MIVAIIFVACLLALIGSIFYGQRLIRKERTDVVFGDPERTSGGWHWIVAGISSLLLLWFYFSWDATRSFFPSAANELCQVAKVSYEIKPIRSTLPIDVPHLKGTLLLKRDIKQILRLEGDIDRVGFNQEEQQALQTIIGALRSTLGTLVSPDHLTAETRDRLGDLAASIDGLTDRFLTPGYPGPVTVVERATALDQPGWGETGIEIPVLPITDRGRKFHAASLEVKKISRAFSQIRNKSPQFESQVETLKRLITNFKQYNEGVTDLEASISASRHRLIKQVVQVFRRIDDGAIFPPAAFDDVERAVRRFDSAQDEVKGNLGFIDTFMKPGGKIIASTHACSEQGSGRWLPKPADTVRNFIRILDPDVGYKNVPMLWYEWVGIGVIIAPLIPDWLSNLVPGEYPRHTEDGNLQENLKSRVFDFATGNYDSIKIPVPTGHIWDSIVRVFLGLLFGVLCGVPLGIFMGLSRFAKGFFDPMIELYRPVPPLAWAPLILTIFGIGDSGKIFLLFMVAFAIMVISSRVGATGTQISKIHAAHSLGASKWQIVREVILPNSLPEILTGIRVAVGVCWGTLVAAEFLAGTTGIGFVENVARKQSHYEIIWVTIVVLGLLGLFMDLIMRSIIARAIPWRGKG